MMTENQAAVTGFLKDEFLKWFTRMSFMGVLALLAWVFTPVGNKFVALWNSPDVIAEVQVSLQELAETVEHQGRAIVIAGAPQDIVEYGPASAFAGGCKPGQTCLLTLEVKRASDRAEKCKIVAGATQREIISAEGGRIWEPEIEPGASSNIADTFVLVETRIRLPAGLKPGRYYYRQTNFYEGCPWQVNGFPPVSTTSPHITLEIEQ
jgi:hypothetical protein